MLLDYPANPRQSPFCISAKATNEQNHSLPNNLQRVALDCFRGFIRSFLGNSTGWWAIIKLQCSQATYKLQEEPLRKVSRTSRNQLVPHSVYDAKTEKEDASVFFSSSFLPRQISISLPTTTRNRCGSTASDLFVQRDG